MNKNLSFRKRFYLFKIGFALLLLNGKCDDPSDGVVRNFKEKHGNTYNLGFLLQGHNKSFGELPDFTSSTSKLSHLGRDVSEEPKNRELDPQESQWASQLAEVYVPLLKERKQFVYYLSWLVGPFESASFQAGLDRFFVGSLGEVAGLFQEGLNVLDQQCADAVNEEKLFTSTRDWIKKKIEQNKETEIKLLCNQLTEAKLACCKAYLWTVLEESRFGDHSSSSASQVQAKEEGKMSFKQLKKWIQGYRNISDYQQLKVEILRKPCLPYLYLFALSSAGVFAWKFCSENNKKNDDLYHKLFNQMVDGAVCAAKNQFSIPGKVDLIGGMVKSSVCGFVSTMIHAGKVYKEIMLEDQKKQKEIGKNMGMEMIEDFEKSVMDVSDQDFLDCGVHFSKFTVAFMQAFVKEVLNARLKSSSDKDRKMKKLFREVDCVSNAKDMCICLSKFIKANNVDPK